MVEVGLHREGEETDSTMNGCTSSSDRSRERQPAERTQPPRSLTPSHHRLVIPPRSSCVSTIVDSPMFHRRRSSADSVPIAREGTVRLLSTVNSRPLRHQPHTVNTSCEGICDGARVKPWKWGLRCLATSQICGNNRGALFARREVPHMTLAAYTDSELELDLRWWAAANYLTVAQIDLQDNVLMREPLAVEHIKPRLLDTGAPPWAPMLYTLLNRHINDTDTEWLYVTGPGHGGPALVAATYLEGTYSEIYPHISSDSLGRRQSTVSSVFDTGGSPARQCPDTGLRPRRVANSGTHSSTRPERRSTTPISWSPALSATARPRRVRCPVRGRSPHS